MDPAMEQDELGDGEHSPGPLSDHSDAEDSTYKPVSGEENSPDDDALIIPEKHLEQENLHRRLIATARSLKKQKQRLKAAHDTLNRRWNKVLDTNEKYGGDRHTKSYPKRKLINLSPERRTVRTTMHTSSRKNTWTKSPSTRDLLPPRGA